MAGLWLDEIADLYDAMARVGLPDPRRVDELELWECASVLGLDRADKDRPAPASGDWQTATAVSASGRDIIAERIYAAEHGLPPPEPDPPTPPPPGVSTLPRVKRDGDG